MKDGVRETPIEFSPVLERPDASVELILRMLLELDQEPAPFPLGSVSEIVPRLIRLSVVMVVDSDFR